MNINGYKKVILDVGCGPSKVEGAIGVDRTFYKGVDIVCDLDIFPWPFKKESFDKIYFNNSLEHLSDIVKVMEEVYRISRKGARICITVPHFSSANTYIDITHKHSFSLFSFKYFTQSEAPFEKNCRFRYIEKRLEFWKLREKFSLIPARIFGIEAIANRFPWFYERFLTYIFPASAIYVVLEVVK